MSSDITIYGKNFERIRAQHAMSMEDFAKLIGISKGTVLRYKKQGVVNIHPKTLRLIAEGLKMTVDEAKAALQTNPKVASASAPGEPTPQTKPETPPSQSSRRDAGRKGPGRAK